MAKTVGIWLGNYKGLPKKFHGINFTDKPVRCLGIYIGHDAEACHTENWMSKIESLKNCMHVWKSRKLTLKGKILIIKSLALSKLIYNFSLIPVPDKIIKEINKMFYDFTWNKIDRIKRKTLILNFHEGGLNMVDLQSKIQALQAAWIPRIIKNHRLGNIIQTQLNKNGINLKIILEGGIVKSKNITNIVSINQFYADCISSFNLCKAKTSKQNVNIYDFLVQ